MLFSPGRLSTAVAILGSTVSAQYVPDLNAEITRELEHILLDAGSAALINAVTPCTKYEDPTTGQTNNNLGRQSAAEWIRTAFRKHKSISSCVLFTIIYCVNALFCA